MANPNPPPSPSPEHKKPKTDDVENIFETIGQQAQHVDANEPEVINASDLRETGAYDAHGRPVQEIDSLCMNCHEQGVTRLLFTDIPRFRQVVLMSFECEHCNFKSNTIQTAAEIQAKGHKMVLTLTKPEDLGRQVIKTEYAICSFPDLEIEVPAGTGRVTTVEGVLAAIRDDLEGDQPVRKHVNAEMFAKIADVIAKLNDVLEGKVLPLKFVLDDPSGNSFVDFLPEEQHINYEYIEYERNSAQVKACGMTPANQAPHMADRINEVAHQLEGAGSQKEEDNVPEEMRQEVQTFIDACPSCREQCPTHMKMVNIPHFKDVIIMSTSCDCGYKSNEVKTGGAIPDKGRKVTLKVEDREDLSRDILKSETCSIQVPELDLELMAGTLGGRFTTIEGLLRQVDEELQEKVLNAQRDEIDEQTRTRWLAFLARLETAIEGNLPFTLKMHDPLAASYIQNLYAPDPDPNMEIEDYARSHEEDEDLGLTHMNV